MARPSDNNAILRYPFETPTQDRSTHQVRVKPTDMVRAWGVDGRFRGSARSFPGFKTVRDITASPYDGTDFTTLGGSDVTDHPYYHLPPCDNSGLTSVWFAKYISVQIPEWYIGTATAKDGVKHAARVLRGWVVAHDYTHDGGQKGRLTFYFYDPVESVWAYHDLLREVGDLEDTAADKYRLAEINAWNQTGAGGIGNIKWPYNCFLTDYSELLTSACTYDVASMGNYIYFCITPPATATVANIPVSGAFHRSVYCGGFGPWPLGVSTSGSEEYGRNTMSKWIPTPIGPPWTKVLDASIADGTDLIASGSFQVDSATHARTDYIDNDSTDDEGPIEDVSIKPVGTAHANVTGKYNSFIRYRYDLKNCTGPVQLSAFQGADNKTRQFATTFRMHTTGFLTAREPVWGVFLRRRCYRTLDDASQSQDVQLLATGTHFREVSEVSMKGGPLITATTTLINVEDDTLNSNAAEVGLKDDPEIVTLPSFDPFLNDRAFSPKKIKLVAPYQGTLLRIGSVPVPARPLDLFDREEILSWGSLSSFSPEQMAVQDSTPLGSSQDEVALALITTGDYCFAVGDTSIFRIHRNGNLLAINEVQSLAGGVSRYAAVGVGTSLVYVSPNGLYMVDGASGQFQLVSAMDRIIQDDWKGTLSSIRMAYDNVLGCMIVMNTDSSIREAQMLWSDTGFITGLKDIPFKWLSSGVDPVNVDNHRAYWHNDSGKIFTVNSDRNSNSYDGGSEGAFTMCGGDPGKTWNGTVGDNATDGVADPTTTTLDILGASYDASCVGSEIYFLSGDNQGEHRTISAQSGDGLTFASLDQACSRGDRVSIAPIYMEMIGWPLQIGGAGTDPFQRKTVLGTGISANLIAGDITLTDNVNLYCEMGVYRRSDVSTMVNGPNKREIVSDQTQHFVRTHYTGTLLYPTWRCYCSNVDLELIEGVVHTLVSASSAETEPVGPNV